jgi:hypothetical protein
VAGRSTRSLAVIVEPYKFDVCLRIWHPSRNLSRAETVFGISPERSWVKGDSRQTPNGTPLVGVYPNSYWYARLMKKQVSSRQLQVEEFLAQTIDQFRECRAYISRLRKSGGRAELFVGLMSTKNYAVELHPDLLRSAATLGLTISLDIYPYAQNDR